MRGKVARQLRNLCNYKAELSEEGYPQLLVKDTKKGHTLVLNSEGEFGEGDFRYDIKEVERDICQLHTDPIRQVYQDLKNQWYKFTALDHKQVQQQGE